MLRSVKIKMECYFFLVGFLVSIIPNMGKSQKLHFTDVENYLNCSQTDCFTNSIESYGFCYDKSQSNTFETYGSCEFFYFKNSGDKTIKTKNYVSFGINTVYNVGELIKCICLTVVTSSKEYYEELFSQLLSEGFEEIAGTSAFRKLYKSLKHDGIELEIVVEEKTVTGIGNYPVYEIYFKKPMKK